MVFQDQVLRKTFSVRNTNSNERDIHSQRSRFFDLLRQKKKDEIKRPKSVSSNDYSNEPSRVITARINEAEYRYDPVEMYSTTCQSSCIKHLILNINPLNNLLLVFFDNFLKVGIY